MTTDYDLFKTTQIHHDLRAELARSEHSDDPDPVTGDVVVIAGHHFDATAEAA